MIYVDQIKMVTRHFATNALFTNVPSANVFYMYHEVYIGVKKSNNIRQFLLSQRGRFNLSIYCQNKVKHVLLHRLHHLGFVGFQVNFLYYLDIGFLSKMSSPIYNHLAPSQMPMKFNCCIHTCLFRDNIWLNSNT